MASKKAEESYQVKKARKKLQKQMEEEAKLKDDKAIAQMKKAMQIWIDRHQSDRVPLKEKPVKLFAENKHSAKVKSSHVTALMEKLQSPEREEQTTEKLVGRVKK